MFEILKHAGRRRVVPMVRALREARARIAQFRRQTQGNVALIFAIAVIPVVTSVGAAVDFSNASRDKAVLDAAADVAALAAVTSSGTIPSTAAARQNGLNSFAGNLSGRTTFQLNSVDISVVDTGLSRSSVVTYSATVKTAFGGLLGVDTFTMTGTSTATSTLPTFIDFHILLDNTPSMGVGATPADVATMVANTSDKCGFACHITGSTTDYYALAKRTGVTMRIDVVRQATQQLMDTAAATVRMAGQFRMAIYTFGASCATPGFTTVTSLTSSLATAKSQASAIDLMTIPSQGYNNDQCTDFDGTLSALNLAIATPGDGATAGAPQKVLLFVSDGVADAYYPSTCLKPTTGGRCQEPINTATCTAIKNRGIRIAVLYTTYLPLTTNSWYNSWIKPFQNEIPARMQDCASPGLYFEVSPTQGIADAMAALFQKAVASARLTR